MICGGTPVPVPVRLIRLGLSVALLAIDSCAERGPNTVGLNETVKFAVAVGATIKGVVTGLRTKSPGLVPVRLAFETVSGAVPLLVSVITAGVLVPSTC